MKRDSQKIRKIFIMIVLFIISGTNFLFSSDSKIIPNDSNFQHYNFALDSLKQSINNLTCLYQTRFSDFLIWMSILTIFIIAMVTAGFFSSRGIARDIASKELSEFKDIKENLRIQFASNIKSLEALKGLSDEALNLTKENKNE